MSASAASYAKEMAGTCVVIIVQFNELSVSFRDHKLFSF